MLFFLGCCLQLFEEQHTERAKCLAEQQLGNKAQIVSILSILADLNLSDNLFGGRENIWVTSFKSPKSLLPYSSGVKFVR